MKTLIALLISASICTAQEWRLVSRTVSGDSIELVKYRCEYMSDTGFVKRTKVERWKCRNLRCTDTTYRTVRRIPESEVEE